jgi:hypothetical protein
MLAQTIMLGLFEKIKKSKLVRQELIKLAMEKYPNAGYAYFKSPECKSIRGLTLDIIITKDEIKNLTNVN